ncbi:uncharacterized protein LOC116117247 [Pistacia vera]|uniref:Uncharacterized protein n=1 Tax=Pistacia integerrima TaxID=434235 RepID=A0ACC0ZAU5_9ROSI|nr:uncharacterized protein LOC116117222 [Pistacia vera]XP_031259143.1 uncharacterized protein LOC116117247 [Pistacia vera]KAJ0047605.1 hypothetical protein Pint_14804 [Pistacia integerrima]
MGNCLFGGFGEVEGVIKVITSTGGIMEFYPPITAACITDEFPGHAIFPSHDLFWKQLSHHEDLLPGKSYYLLPLNETTVTDPGGQIVREGHVRSNSIPTSLVSSYRMSCDYHGTLKRSYTEVFSKYNTSSGFWKVKLVISPQQLLEILSQEGRTQELIESVRTVAKCGNGVSSIASSVAFSDQWSLSSSSRNASSKKDYLLEI